MTFIFAAFLMLPMIVAAPAKAAGTDDYIDYTGDVVTFTQADGSEFGMFRPQEGTTIAIDGDNVVIHYIPNNKTVYKWIHWGKIDNLAFPYEVKQDDFVINEDGTMDFSLPKTVCGHGLPVAPIKSDLTKTTGSQYYLMIPAEEKIKTARELSREELTITNNINMFKLVTAYVEKDSSGTYLVFALSGSGYHYLYRGDYDQAVANGDQRDNWIAGYQNADAKWEFEMKLQEGDTYIPVVAISDSYLKKYEQGVNPLARAFYPRQLTLDLEAKTIVADDYHETIEIKVDNKANMFKPGTATLTTIGGPNSNGYTINMDLIMDSESLDAVFIGEKDEAAAEGAQIVEVVDGKHFTLKVEYIVTPGNPDTTVSYLNDPIILSFRSKKNQTWNEKKATISKTDKTVVFENPGADYSGVDAAIASIPEDLENYKEETVKPVEEARDAVIRDYNFKHQDQVDAMAAAINDAIAGLALKDEVVAARTQELIDNAKKDYPTAAEKQAAVDAAKAAYEAMSPEQKALLPDAEKEIEEAQKAADNQKEAEEKAKEVAVGTQATVGGFVYKTTSKTEAALVKPAKKTLTKASIPATVKIQGQTFKVTAIQAKAFKKNTKLKTLTIGANVTSIGASAYEGCKKLAKITVPAKVTTIGKSAFKNCAAAKSITLGKGVKTIGASAFMGCKKATKLVIKGTAIKSWGKKSFAKTGIKKLSAPKKKKAAFKKKFIKAGGKKTVK